MLISSTACDQIEAAILSCGEAVEMSAREIRRYLPQYTSNADLWKKHKEIDIVFCPYLPIHILVLSANFVLN